MRQRAKSRNEAGKHPFTPTSGSWMIQIERRFAKITEERIRRASFTSVASLEKAIKEYPEYNNENPKPFIGTADAHLILGKIQRLCNGFPNCGFITHPSLQRFPCFLNQSLTQDTRY